MSQTLRKFARELPFLRHFIARYVIPSGYYDKAFINLPLSNSWKQRIALAIESPDNQFIQRVQNAGVIIKGKQIMHNGLMINLGSYYGSEIAKLLLENRGVHEPQEERVFQEIIPTIAPGSKMLELGSFWAFYSLWFKSKIPHSTCYMIEPDKFNIESGKANFKLNGYQGNFFNYFISDKSSLKNHKQTPTICVDDFMAEQGIDFLEILHCDIQGYEHKMLLGAEQTIVSNKVGYIFISTHSNELHEACFNWLIEHQFKIIASANLSESYSEDGLLVAKSINYKGIEPIEISRRK